MWRRLESSQCSPSGQYYITSVFSLPHLLATQLCYHQQNVVWGSHATWKVWDFIYKNSRTWKVVENAFGPGKSWKLKFKILESPGIYLWFNLNNMHFMYKTPCVNKCMKYSCYLLADSFFATCDKRLAMDCTVTLYIPGTE